MAGPDSDEKDWKTFRKLRAVALERECQKIVGELEKLGKAPGKTWHERYLAIVKRLRNRQKDVADAFDDIRRSTMMRQLLFMRSCDMVSDEDLRPFSEKLRSSIAFMMKPLDVVRVEDEKPLPAPPTCPAPP